VSYTSLSDGTLSFSSLEKMSINNIHITRIVECRISIYYLKQKHKNTSHNEKPQSYLRNYGIQENSHCHITVVLTFLNIFLQCAASAHLLIFVFLFLSYTIFFINFKIFKDTQGSLYFQIPDIFCST